MSTKRYRVKDIDRQKRREREKRNEEYEYEKKRERRSVISENRQLPGKLRATETPGPIPNKCNYSGIYREIRICADIANCRRHSVVNGREIGSLGSDSIDLRKSEYDRSIEKGANDAYKNFIDHPLEKN